MKLNPPELLTPFGRWLRDRVPHVIGPKNPWPWAGDKGFVFRIHLCRPGYGVRCLFDITRTGHRGNWSLRIRVIGCGLEFDSCERRAHQEASARSAHYGIYGWQEARG